MITSPEKRHLDRGGRTKREGTFVLYIHILHKIPAFFFNIRHDVTTTHDIDRTFHDWGFGRKGWGADAFGHSPAFFETILCIC
jgi:hypothetical protein